MEVSPRGEIVGTFTNGQSEIIGQVAIAKTLFDIAYQPGITAAMRVVHDGKNYNIKHVNNVFEENKDLILTCETGANDG